MKRWYLEKVISGAQTGVDQAGLRVGKALNYQTGGFMPKGFITDIGPMPDLAKEYGLVPCKAPGYPARTKLNVQFSDGTVLLGHMDSPGCKLTVNYARDMDLPYLKIRRHWDTMRAIDLIRLFVTEKKIKVLNIAGNRESSYPGIGMWAERILFEALKKENHVSN